MDIRNRTNTRTEIVDIRTGPDIRKLNRVNMKYSSGTELKRDTIT